MKPDINAPPTFTASPAAPSSDAHLPLEINGRLAVRVDDFRRHALREHVDGRRQRVGGRVTVNVDKSRRDVQAAGLDFRCGVRRAKITDGNDVPAADTDIRGEAGATRSVDHGAMSNDDVERAGGTSGLGWSGAGHEDDGQECLRRAHGRNHTRRGHALHLYCRRRTGIRMSKNQEFGTVEGADGILTIRGGDNVRGWNGIRYKAGLSAKNVGAKKLSMNVATIPPGGVAYAHIHVGFEVMLYILAGRVRHEYGPALEKTAFENQAGELHLHRARRAARRSST